MNIQPKITALLKNLNTNIIEKEEAIGLTLLSAIAGESIFYLGKPGTAKSLIARRIKDAFSDAKSFEYLMHKFSTPDEIFGPVSISKLKNEDKYERKTEGYLPTSEVVFLDEIWKASSAIQNTLLTAVNERTFKNGTHNLKIPMKLLVAASNELPQEGEGQEALFDRFLVRLCVNGIEKESNFEKMLLQTANPNKNSVGQALKITGSEYQKWSKEINQIEISSIVLKIIHQIRHELKKQVSLIVVSDRRWQKVIRLLRTSAFLNNQKEVRVSDCFLIEYCIWNTVEQISVVKTIVADAINANGLDMTKEIAEIKEKIKDFEKQTTNAITYRENVSYRTPKIHSKEYYRLKGQGLPYGWNYCPFIKVVDFKSITSRRKTLGFLNNNQSGVFNFEIKKGEQEFSLIHNQGTYLLETEEKSKTQTFNRKPNQRVKSKLDKQADAILASINELSERITLYQKEDIAAVKNHLFVQTDASVMMEKNVRTLENIINKLNLEVEKINTRYENVKPSSPANNLEKISVAAD